MVLNVLHVFTLWQSAGPGSLEATPIVSFVQVVMFFNNPVLSGSDPDLLLFFKQGTTSKLMIREVHIL